MPSRVIRLLSILAVGLLMAGCDDFGGTDPGPFAIVALEPADGSSDVSVLQTLEVRFTNRLASSTIPGAVRLMTGGRELVVEVERSGPRKLRIIPTDPLDFGTEFQVRIDPTLQDQDGNLWSDQVLWSFTTTGQPPPKPSVDSLRHHLEALAHDTLQGRGSGSEDELRAATYIQDRLERYGLSTVAGGYFQSFVSVSKSYERTTTSQNVLAAVDGTGDLAREWIVVGAHYDHVGVRQLPEGSMGIHNGADDNASGTVAVLELARLFRAYADNGGMADESRRSVLFSLYGAEEIGLLGSCHYVENPLVPLSDTKAMMNFDMVGRLRQDVVFARGTDLAPAMGPLVQNSNSPGLKVMNTPACPRCTDHSCFLFAGIPFIWFYTGSHEDYHTPRDDSDLINYPGLAEITEVSFRALVRLAVSRTPPALILPG